MHWNGSNHHAHLKRISFPYQHPQGAISVIKSENINSTYSNYSDCDKSQHLNTAYGADRFLLLSDHWRWHKSHRVTKAVSRLNNQTIKKRWLHFDLCPVSPCFTPPHRLPPPHNTCLPLPNNSPSPTHNT